MSNSSIVYVKLGHEIREVRNEKSVQKYLMDDYRASVRPVKNDSDTVHVKVGLYLNILEDLVRSAVAVLLHTLCLLCYSLLLIP